MCVCVCIYEHTQRPLQWQSAELQDGLPGGRRWAAFCSCRGISGRWIWREVCWGMAAAVSSATENTEEDPRERGPEIGIRTLKKYAVRKHYQQVQMVYSNNVKCKLKKKKNWIALCHQICTDSGGKMFWDASCICDALHQVSKCSLF